MNQIFARTRIFLALLVLLSFTNAGAQTITVTRFNSSAVYFPGAGVSVGINPSGVFNVGNQFILELSDATGSFAAPTTLTTATEFFIPVLNGTIPSGATAGTRPARVTSCAYGPLRPPSPPVPPALLQCRPAPRSPNPR
jgi:hypothetical protein